ncbi:MAG: TIGR01777 family oxidoreductase [bacterium]|nr:TIGR01777 family oxidoreductase [bacterium]
MRIAITGASGFVGSHLVKLLRDRGDEAVPLVRRRPAPTGAAFWDPTTGEIDRSELGEVDAVVHLAGDTVAERWSEAKKQRIADSRGPATSKLAATLAELDPKPRVLVSASAVGIYGSRGDEELDEDSDLCAGDDFLGEVAKAWETGTAAASAAGIRVVHLRIGLVLEPSGGALKKMLPPFRFGVGGRLGSGRQWLSWITRHDLVRAIAFALDNSRVSGPVLGVGPNPVTNATFTKALGRALRRPTILPVPAFALRLLFGEMADGALLASQRAIPRRLLDEGFEFEHPELEPALTAMLG